MKWRELLCNGLAPDLYTLPAPASAASASAGHAGARDEASSSSATSRSAPSVDSGPVVNLLATCRSSCVFRIFIGHDRCGRQIARRDGDVLGGCRSCYRASIQQPSHPTLSSDGRRAQPAPSARRSPHGAYPGRPPSRRTRPGGLSDPLAGVMTQCAEIVPPLTKSRGQWSPVTLRLRIFTVHVPVRRTHCWRRPLVCVATIIFFALRVCRDHIESSHAEAVGPRPECWTGTARSVCSRARSRRNG